MLLIEQPSILGDWARVDNLLIRCAGGFLLYLNAHEAPLVESLLTHPDGIRAQDWLSAEEPEQKARMAALPGLLARGVVRLDGERLVLAPASASAPLSTPHRDQGRRRHQADILAALVRARGGTWVHRGERTPTISPPAVVAPPARASVSDHQPGTVVLSTSWRTDSHARTRDQLMSLLGEQSGLIAGLRRGSGLPADVPVWFTGPNRALSTAHPSGLTWRWPGSAMGKGATDAEAQVSALAEAAERWSGTWQPSDHAAGCPSSQELQAEGVGADALGMDPMTPTSWWAGTRMHDKADVRLPAAHVLIGHPPVGGQVVRTDSNGLAAGTSAADATLQGLLELIERDALARWWNGADGFTWDQPHDEQVGGVRDWFDWLGIELEIRRLPATAGVPVVLALGRPPGSERLLYGAGAHLDANIAYRRAVFELGQSVVAARATARELAPSAGFRPPRTLGPPLHDHEAVQAPTMTEVGPAVDHLVTSLAAQGIEVYMCDVTRPEVAVPVVRVIAPRLSVLPAAMR